MIDEGRRRGDVSFSSQRFPHQSIKHARDSVSLSVSLSMSLCLSVSLSMSLSVCLFLTASPIAFCRSSQSAVGLHINLNLFHSKFLRVGSLSAGTLSATRRDDQTQRVHRLTL
jgi:hypothetical protein